METNCIFDREKALLRTEMLLGEGTLKTLATKKVILFGIGGVGGHAAEALARSGVSSITIVDHDVVSLSNINRQAVATMKTIGRSKVSVMTERIMEINPECKVVPMDCFMLPDNIQMFHLNEYDYILDAIDTVSSKIQLAMIAEQENIPIISAMGAGNKLDPTRFEVTDIYKTSVCPLCKVMRRELKNRGVKHLEVVFSTEEPVTPAPMELVKENSRPAPGSCAFVPSVVGLIMAGVVVKKLIKNDVNER